MPGPTPQPAPVPPRAQLPEVRAVWVSNTDRLDWDTATRQLQQYGFNTMDVNFATGGAAFYPSKFLPNIVGDDPLANGIALARQRGIQVHAKLIATFMFKSPPEFQKRYLATNRVMCGPDGQPITQAGQYWLCPTVEANRTLLAGVTTEMLTRYPVAGLHFDYIRFSEQPSCFCDVCRREFERTLGQPVSRWPRDVTEGALARRTHPPIILSSAVFSDLNRSREEKAQDWKKWLDAGYLDYVCTMTYTPNPTEFTALIRNQLNWTGHSRRLVVGIGSWKFAERSQLRTQLDITRRLGANGFALFSYDDCAARDFFPTVGRAGRAE